MAGTDSTVHQLDMDLSGRRGLAWIRSKLEAGYCIGEVTGEECDRLRDHYGGLLHARLDPREGTYSTTLLGVHSPNDWEDQGG